MTSGRRGEAELLAEAFLAAPLSTNHERLLRRLRFAGIDD